MNAKQRWPLALAIAAVLHPDSATAASLDDIQFRAGSGNNRVAPCEPVVAAVPEPGAIPLVLMGLLVAGLRLRVVRR